VEELLREVARMEAGEKRFSEAAPPDDYERELRLAGLAQRVSQAYTIIEGVLAFVARRIDRAPLAGEDWHQQLIARCASSYDKGNRPRLLSDALASDLLELCAFRHVARNIYPTRLDGSRVQRNLALLIRAAREFGDACRTFAATLPPAGNRPRRSRTRRSGA
jgi:hypothetical protein